MISVRFCCKPWTHLSFSYGKEKIRYPFNSLIGVEKSLKISDTAERAETTRLGLQRPACPAAEPASSSFYFIFFSPRYQVSISQGFCWFLGGVEWNRLWTLSRLYCLNTIYYAVSGNRRFFRFCYSITCSPNLFPPLFISSPQKFFIIPPSPPTLVLNFLYSFSTFVIHISL